MSDPFFSSKKSANKRKRPNTKISGSSNKDVNIHVNKAKTGLEENLSEGTTDDENVEESDKDSEDEKETADEKRLRLAKEYLQSLKNGLPEDELEVDALDIDRDIIADRLQKDALEVENRLYFLLTDQIPSPEEFTIKIKKAHQLAVTAVAVDPLGEFIYTGSKDSSIIKWNLKTMDKIHTFPGAKKGVKKFDGHTGHILCLALSYDGKILASGGKDKLINLWDVSTNTYKGCLKQHKDAVSGLVFRLNTYDLYSCSFDRTVKVWNAEEMGYIETLFGHQDMIYDIKALAREQCVTTGARDKTLRLWKIIDQTQLIFRGGIPTKYNKPVENEDNEVNNEEPSVVKYVEGSVDKIAMLDEANFVSGGDSGSLCIWSTSRKKPVSVHGIAHGIDPSNQQPFPISALASFPFTDLVASGSSDGFLRLWKVTYGNKRTLHLLASIPMAGFINSISITTKDPKHHSSSAKAETQNEKIYYQVVVGLGQESAYGRWERITEGKNRVVVIEIPLNGCPKSL